MPEECRWTVRAWNLGGGAQAAAGYPATSLAVNSNLGPAVNSNLGEAKFESEKKMEMAGIEPAS